MNGGEKPVRIYLADIRPLFREETLRRAYGLLDGARQKKMDALGTVPGRAACAAAGLLMRYALEQNGQAGARVEYTPLGQPVTEKGYLSVSHSGIYAVCAWDPNPVGVDIQELRRIRAGMLCRCLTAAERRVLERKWAVRGPLDAAGLETAFPGREGEPPARDGGASDPRREGGVSDPRQEDGASDPRQKDGTGTLSPEQGLDFLRLFSAKESYMKLTGQGMSLGFDRIEADPAAGTVSDPQGQWAAARLYECAAPEGYVLTVCRAAPRREGPDAAGESGMRRNLWPEGAE